MEYKEKIERIKNLQFKILNEFLDLMRENKQMVTKDICLKFMNEANEVFIKNLNVEYIIKEIYQ